MPLSPVNKAMFERGRSIRLKIFLSSPFLYNTVN